VYVLSGEKWHDLVKFTLNLGIFGLENLALIPGCIGSAAIQNIGAYGSEFKDFCEYVDILCSKKNIIIRMNKSTCKFTYRSSIFKKQYHHKNVIIGVGLKIKKKWQPIIWPLLKEQMLKINLTAHNIFNLICKIRKEKLPDPKQIGNAGSFFKNPIITQKKARKLISLYNLPWYPEKNNLIKISGGWLIEYYDFKNITIGDAAIYQKQKLILINKKNASAQEILILAKIIHKCILEKFHISLEPEIDFIGSIGKIKPLDILKKQ